MHGLPVPTVGAATADRRAGVLFIAFAVAVQIPFALLASRFGYPDVLRLPAGEVLQAFHAGGRGLVMIWYGYAMSIGLFAAAALAFAHGRAGHRAATVLALASAVVQWVALARWTFAVPLLARLHATTSEPLLRAGIEQQFELLNSLLGVGLGEHLGQLLMGCWTLAMLRLLPRQHRAWRGLGVLSAVLLFAGLSEQLGTALALDVGALAALSMGGFVAWAVWLVAVGVHLWRQAVPVPPAVAANAAAVAR